MSSRCIAWAILVKRARIVKWAARLETFTTILSSVYTASHRLRYYSIIYSMLDATVVINSSIVSVCRALVVDGAVGVGC